VNVARVGLAGAAGKATQETMEQIQGENLQSFMEVTADVAKEGAIAAGSEGGVRLFGAAGRKLFAPEAKRMTPARRTALREAQDIGLSPYSSQVTDAPLVGRFEAMYARLFGDEKAVYNSMVLHKEMKRLKDVAGLGGNRVTTGEALVRQVTKYRDTLTKLVNTTKERISREIDASMNSLRGRIGDSSGDAGTILRADIKAGRREFSAQAKNVYSVVDEMAGQPIVPTAALKMEAKDQLTSIVKTVKGEPVAAAGSYTGLLQRINELPDNISLAEMQELRTVFGEAAYDPNIIGSVSKRHMKNLKNAANQAFEDVSDLNKGVAAQLKKADEFYKEGIEKYNNLTIKALTKADNVSTVDAEQIATLVATKPTRVKAVRDVIFRNGDTPEARQIWDTIKREHFDEIVHQSTLIDKSIDGKSFLKKLAGGTPTQRSAMRDMYGNQYDEMVAIAKKIAAFDGKIDPATLPAGDDTVKLLKAALKQQERLDAHMAKNFVKDLNKDGVEFTQAVRHIFKKDSPRRIAEAKKFYGETSATWMKARRQAMSDVLLNIVGKTDDPFTAVFNGTKLLESLDGYGKETLNEMFGKDLTSQLYKFARSARFITRKPAQDAGGLVAANIAIRPLANIGRLAKIWTIAKAMQSTRGLTYMTEGVMRGKSMRSRAQAINRFGIYMYSLGSGEEGDLFQYVGRDRPEEPSK
jgi:hypothetical protein